MSVTTTGNQLTRSQSAQMPALLEFYSPSAALIASRPKGSARGVIWTVVEPVRRLRRRRRIDPDRQSGHGSWPGRRHQRAPSSCSRSKSSIVREIDVQEGQSCACR